MSNPKSKKCQSCKKPGFTLYTLLMTKERRQQLKVYCKQHNTNGAKLINSLLHERLSGIPLTEE